MQRDILDELDAERLVAEYSVEQLSQSAEDYYARLTNWDFLLAKPFGSIAEAPTILAHLGAMLSALELEIGMQILDFGAGGCWTTRVFAQLGCVVTACDVSETALSIGRARFASTPTVGPVPAPSFLVLDGRRLELPDDSVDRVACMDAFHHVPNQAEVLAEMARVLRPGGRAVLAEPGPAHSRSAQAQAEMRSAQVVERDIVVEDLAEQAVTAGFDRVDVGIYAGAPELVDASSFERHLRDGEIAARRARVFMENHRLLVLHMAGVEQRTSRSTAGLSAHIDVKMRDRLRGTAVVTNTGTATWISSDSGMGGVNLGIQLCDERGNVLDLDHHRVPLRRSADGLIAPGESVTVAFEMVDRPPGPGRLVFDCVAEGVAWFGMLGSPTVTVDADVNG